MGKKKKKEKKEKKRKADAGGGGWEVEEILAQCFAAIGQGAGGKVLSRPAVRAVRAAYLRPLERNAERWDEISLVVLEYGRSLGQLAARLATDEGRANIDAPHVKKALDRIAKPSGDAQIMWPCPLC